MIQFRRKVRRVVLHHAQMKESLEGLWDGRLIDGHYPLTHAKLLLGGGQERQVIGELLIPADRVTFIQVLAQDARR